MRLIKKRVNIAAYYIIVFLITIIFIGPIIWMIVMSFHPEAGIFTTLAAFKPTLRNYIEVFKRILFLKSFLNSVLISLATSLVAVILSLPLSYILARFTFRCRADLGFWFLSGRIIPPIAVIIPFLILFSRIKIIDNQLALILVYLIPTIAFSVLIMLPFIRNIPESIEEAAMVDGCTGFSLILHIIVPLSRHGIIVAFIFSLITCWNEFFFAFVLTRQNVRTLPVLIQSFLTYSNVRWGEMMATSTIVVIPLIIFVFLIQDYLVTGLTLGAVEK